MQARPLQSFSLSAVFLMLHLPRCDTSSTCTYYTLILAKLVALQLWTPLITLPLIILLLPQLTCYHSQLSSDSQHSCSLSKFPGFQHWHRSTGWFLPSPAAQYCMWQLTEGPSQYCCFVSSSPPAFWPFQTKCCPHPPCSLHQQKLGLFPLHADFLNVFI